MKQTYNIARLLKSAITVLTLTLSVGAIVNTSPASMASFSNNAEALDALGQYTDESLTAPIPMFTKAGAGDSPNIRGMNDTGGIALDTSGHRLFVSDTGNGRVLVYNLNPDNTLEDLLPDFVLGKPDFTTATTFPFEYTSTNLRSPKDLAYDSLRNRLFVADINASRILVFDVNDISNGEAAIHILGQTDFTSNDFDSGLNRVGSPSAIEYDEARDLLFVATTTANNKIIVFDTATITNGEDAQTVLVHSTLNNSNSTPTAGDTLNISGLAYDPDRQLLFASDSLFHRVLVYDVATITTDEDAVFVLGQTDFSSKTAAVTASGLNTPQALEVSGDFLFVGQHFNYRATVFDISTITNGEAAIHVLGQANFTNSSEPVASASKIRPSILFVDSATQRLFVSGLNSVKIFDISTITDNEDAVGIIGQADYSDPLNPTALLSREGANNNPDPYGLKPGKALVDEVNHRLFVADTANRRILVYNLDDNNLLVDRFPDNVLGKTSLSDSSFTGVTDASLLYPDDLALDTSTNRLFVADGSTRVMVFDVQDITDGEAAIHVLGQTTFTTIGSPAFPTAGGMEEISSIEVDSEGQRLFVGDQGFMRILIFDISSITNGEDAIHVLGQPNMTTLNFSPHSATSTRSPNAMVYDDLHTRLYVADLSANRVLVFDLADITDNEAAVHVLGQEDFVTTSPPPSFPPMPPAATESNTLTPIGLALDKASQRLFVSQLSANRVTFFDTRTITDGENSLGVLGQADFQTKNPGTTRSTLSGPQRLSYASSTGHLYVSDAGNNRLLVFDAQLPESVIVVEESDGTTEVTEEGVPNSDTFTVRLSSYLDSDVVIDLTSSAPEAISLDVPTLTFTPDNWNVEQTVTVTATADANAVSETPTVTLTVNDTLSDDRYLGLSPTNIAVTVTDTTVIVPPVVAPPSSGGGGGGFSAPTPSPEPSIEPSEPTTTPEEPTRGSAETEEPQEETTENSYAKKYSTGSAKNFADIREHWSYEYIDILTQYCDISGYTEGNKNVFRPDEAIQRSEFVSLVLQCLGEPPSTPGLLFSDVDTKAWYAGYLQKASELGWVTGYPDGTFRPGNSMLREEAVKFLMTAGFSDDTLKTQAAPYLDVPADAWYAPFANSAFVRGIMTGYKDRTGNDLYIFGVKEPVRRGEVAKILSNILEGVAE